MIFHCSALAALLLDDAPVLPQGHARGSCTGSVARGLISLLGRWVFHLFGLFGLLTHNLLIELFTTARENLFDVLPCFGRRLKALVDTVLSGELNSAVEIDFSGRLQLTFVTDEVDAHILCSMLLDLLQPTAQVLECLITRDVVSEENAMSAAIKYPSYRLERLLTSLKTNRSEKRIALGS